MLSSNAGISAFCVSVNSFNFFLLDLHTVFNFMTQYFLAKRKSSRVFTPPIAPRALAFFYFFGILVGYYLFGVENEAKHILLDFA